MGLRDSVIDDTMGVVDSAVLNRLLELRVKDLAMSPPLGTVDERKLRLKRCLGLDPLPDRTDLRLQVTGILIRSGYRIEKLRYESLPGVLVVARLYIPDGDQKWPVILRPHGHWPEKSKAHPVQAGAIGLALAGFATLVVESPGYSSDDNATNERREMGSHDDPYLAMGWPVHGQYTWDLMRGLDYLESREDMDTKRVGITGESGGGTATMYAFAVDERIHAAVPVVATSSLGIQPNLGCFCNHVPAIMSVGDRADILGLRAPDAPVFIISAQEDKEFPENGHRRTYERLKKLYGSSADRNVRFEVFWGGHDYNRRMREAALAFFSEHLLGADPAPYKPETRPLTDGGLNPAPSETEDPYESALVVTEPWDRSTRSFRSLLAEKLEVADKLPYNAMERLTAWRKFGPIKELRPGGIFSFHDSSVNSPSEPGSLRLPTDQIEIRHCLIIGISVAEFLAQYLHYALPCGPEGWEGAAIGADAFTSMIASVKTLMTPIEPPPRLFVAEGPVASQVARILTKLRPGTEAHVSHEAVGWDEALREEIRENIQPLARYLVYPWERGKVS
jgi:dienelactone hydrolase